MNLHFKLATASILISSVLAGTDIEISSMRRDISNKTFPRFENGILCGVDMENHRVYALKADGTSMFDMMITIPDATSATANRCTAASNGTVVFSGWATNSSGATVVFLAFVHSSGAIARIQQMDIAPSRMSFDPNGNLWIAGGVLGTKYKIGDPRDIFVRRYSLDGKVLQSLTIPYPLESKSDPGPLYQAFATSTSQGLYILAIQRKSMIFVPLAKDGEVVQPKIRNFDATMLPSDISGFTVTRTGDAYLSGIAPAPQTKFGKQNAYFRWEDSTHTWKQMEVEAHGQNKPLILLGTDGDRLLSSFLVGEFVWHTAH